MSTKAYDNIRYLAQQWEKIYRSAVCSGIVGDKAHQSRGGYHIGRTWNPPGNYSVTRPDDRSGPGDASTAIDISMNAADMKLCTQRLRAVWLDKSDPRRKYLNAFNGWLGVGSALRFDMVSGSKKRATSDHTWHVHCELRRKWCLSRVAADGVLSVVRGQSKADYLKSIKASTPAVAAKPATPGKPAPKVRTAPAFPRGKELKLGARNDADLKAWQTVMLARGYRSLGKADGDFGPKTRAVCIAFQRLCKVTADGIIGPVTFALAWTRPLG